MVTCPKCGSRIPARKVLFMSNFSTVTCPSCLEKLQVKNRDFGRLVGASGALILIAIFWLIYLIRPGGLSLFLVALFPVSAVVIMFTWVRFLKLEVKS